MTTDETKICKDCSEEYTLTLGEKSSYDRKGFKYPVRCKKCRIKRKEQANSPFFDALNKIKGKGRH